MNRWIIGCDRHIRVAAGMPTILHCPAAHPLALTRSFLITAVSSTAVDIRDEACVEHSVLNTVLSIPHH